MIFLIPYPNIRNVNLTYLRGLEIAELKEEDTPVTVTMVTTITYRTPNKLDASFLIVYG